MKEIKTREAVRNIRTLDKTVSVAEKMRNTYVRTKEQTEQGCQADADSPESYASDRVNEITQGITRTTGNALRNQRRQLANRIKAPYKEECGQTDYTARGRAFSQDRVRRRTYNDCAGKEKRYGTGQFKTKADISEKTIKTNAKNSIKTAEQSVKSVERTSNEAIKTTHASNKTAAKTTKAAEVTAQKTKQAGKAAATSIKTPAKALATAAKAAGAAVKDLVAAIAAGGWAAAVVIVVVLLAAYILGSMFGVFASGESYKSEPSMPEVVSQINTEFSEKIDSIIQENPHDRLVIDNAGSATMAANWDDVLAVYAVLVSTDPDNPMEVATLNNEKIDKLKTVFWDMNRIDYSLDVVQVGTDDKTGKAITGTVLTITVSSLSTEDMISNNGLDAERAKQVRELLKPEYAELFQRLIGNYTDITLSAEEISKIIETLPDDLSEERKKVVLTAYSLLGKVQYFWGGKSLAIGWDSRWGTPTKVTSEGSRTTGTVRPFGMDCSGFVDWVFYNAYDGEYILGHGGGASDQYSYCDAIVWSDAQPGDLVFYPECEHVGIVVKNDAGTLTVIHCASGYNNVVMTQHTEGKCFAFVGRPKIYDE